jgi:hypothetical protein
MSGSERGSWEDSSSDQRPGASAGSMERDGSMSIAIVDSWDVVTTDNKRGSS